MRSFYISPLAISRNCQPLLNNIFPSLDLQNLYVALIKVTPSLQKVNFTGGAFAAITQPMQDFTFTSNSLSIFS